MTGLPGPLRFWPILAGSTFLSTPGIKGLVLDGGTGEPIAAARVYAVWKRRFRGADGQVTEETARKFGAATADDGYFQIPPYFLFNPAPSTLGHAGSFAFMVVADGYRIKLYTFQDPESLAGYEPYDWKEIALISGGGRMTVALSKISDQAMPDDEGDHLPEHSSATDFLESAGPDASEPRRGGGFAYAHYALRNCRAVTGKPDTAPDASEPRRAHVRQRILTAREKLAEYSKK